MNGVVRRSRAVAMAPGNVTVLLLVITIVCAFIFAPDFWTRANVSSMLGDMFAPALVLLAASIAMTGGVADLSIGAVLGLGGMTYALAYSQTGSWFLALVVAVATGLLVGGLNGTLALVFGVKPLIATLGMLVAADGLVRVLGGGSSVAAYAPDLSRALKTTVGPIPISLLIVLLLAVGGHLLIRLTRLGHHLRATGGQDVIARRAGIRVTRLRLALFLLTSGTAAVAGAIQVMRTGAAAVTLGEGVELYAYGALLIAGYRIAGGGYGNPMTALVSLLALSVVLNIFRLRGMPLPLEDILLGATLLIAVSIDWLRARRELRPRVIPIGQRSAKVTA